VFGESKSEGSFAAEDVARAEALRARFPDAFLAFASFKEKLDPDEIALLTPLARPKKSDRRPRADVIILTRTELFAREDLRSAWEAAGGRMAKLAPKNYGWSRGGHWFALADLTQQMHLGLEPFSEWREGWLVPKRRGGGKGRRAR
jgi:hypothetical protein